MDNAVCMSREIKIKKYNKWNANMFLRNERMSVTPWQIQRDQKIHKLILLYGNTCGAGETFVEGWVGRRCN